MVDKNNSMYDSWKEYMTDMYVDDMNTRLGKPDLYYVADDTGLVMLDDVDFETAYKYANRMENCGAYRKI
jgi:hypothetical protein